MNVCWLWYNSMSGAAKLVSLSAGQKPVSAEDIAEQIRQFHAETEARRKQGNLLKRAIQEGGKAAYSKKKGAGKNKWKKNKSSKSKGKAKGKKTKKGGLLK